MVSVREFVSRVKFWRDSDRIGLDIPTTHARLFFRSSMHRMCSKKFKHFGENSEFRPGAFAEGCSKISIGANVVIRPGTFLFADPTEGGGGITIEDDVLIGPCVHFYTNNHFFSDPNVPIINQGFPPALLSNSIIVHKGSWIGAGSILLPGVEVGANSVIGAGSVVTKSVPPKVLSAGNPAKILRNL